MPYRANEMFFYEDGLSHETLILESADSDECYRALIAEEKSNKHFLGRVVEVDADGKTVWTHSPPYPRVKEPDYPDFYLAYVRGKE